MQKTTCDLILLITWYWQNAGFKLKLNYSTFFVATAFQFHIFFCNLVPLKKHLLRLVETELFVQFSPHCAKPFSVSSNFHKSLDSMTEELNEKNLIGFLKTLIRYFASGFMFIIVYEYLHGGTKIWEFTADNINWSIVVMATISGLLIYAIHQSFLDDIFYFISLLYLRTLKIDYWPEERNIRKVMFLLSTYRYSRPGKINEIKSTHERLDWLLTILTFLYTASYSLIILPLIFSEHIHKRDILLAGIFILICGVFLDVKLTRRELFMLQQETTANSGLAQ